MELFLSKNTNQAIRITFMSKKVNHNWWKENLNDRFTIEMVIRKASHLVTAYNGTKLRDTDLSRWKPSRWLILFWGMNWWRWVHFCWYFWVKSAVLRSLEAVYVNWPFFYYLRLSPGLTFFGLVALLCACRLALSWIFMVHRSSPPPHPSL